MENTVFMMVTFFRKGIVQVLDIVILWSCDLVSFVISLIVIMKLRFFDNQPLSYLWQSFTVFPHVVSAETIHFLNLEIVANSNS